MNWEQFLKPDWKKIILTIILFFLFGGLPDDLANFFIIFRWPYTIGRFLLCPKTGSGGGFAAIAAPLYCSFGPIILEIFYLYLLSCLIIWIYEKVKKK